MSKSDGFMLFGCEKVNVFLKCYVFSICNDHFCKEQNPMKPVLVIELDKGIRASAIEPRRKETN